jgi:1,4-dihydroxy-2-naphthoyl-CoA hydrolase
VSDASFDAALTDQIRRAMPFAERLGIEFVAADAEEVRARLAWDPQLCTGGGVLHGGALMGLADAAGATLAFLNLPDGSVGTTTMTSSSNFCRGLRSGPVLATARLLHRGRSTIVVETDLTDADGRRLARVTQTQAVLR